MNFDIKTEQLSGDAYVISLTGEVDLYTAPEFKQQLLEVIGQGGKEVIVDFSGTTFIDSTTLGVLVGGVKRLRTNDGQLSLVCNDRNITKIFEITGLDQIRLGSGQVATYTTNKKFTVQQPMPADLVTGQDAVDVAAYVASVASTGGPGASPTSVGTNGAAIFKTNCASCHTLAAAGATGTVGPDLDQLKPAMALVVHQVTNGGAIMPAFKGKLTAAQIQAVAKYVSSSAGKK